ncbi:MAG: hypothetical protein H6887_12755 [Hoeflea sp.]|nr:hypothetical protein [Hoeflea sp.]
MSVGLGENYDLILDPVVSAHVAYSGMIEGWFRPCKLADFCTDAGLDYAAARDIVNGDAKMIGEEIARNCTIFEAALRAAGADQNFGPPVSAVDWPGPAKVSVFIWIMSRIQRLARYFR